MTEPAIGVLYPDMDKITTLGAFYQYGPPGNPWPSPTTQTASEAIDSRYRFDGADGATVAHGARVDGYADGATVRGNRSQMRDCGKRATVTVGLIVVGIALVVAPDTGAGAAVHVARAVHVGADRSASAEGYGETSPKRVREGGQVSRTPPSPTVSTRRNRPGAAGT